MPGSGGSYRRAAGVLVGDGVTNGTVKLQEMINAYEDRIAELEKERDEARSDLLECQEALEQARQLAETARDGFCAVMGDRPEDWIFPWESD